MSQRRRPGRAAPAPAPLARFDLRLWFAAAIVVSGLIAYANAPGHPLIFDDGGSIVENGTIRSIGQSLGGGPPQSATAGRPLVNLTFALNYAVGGVSPWGYHAVNLAIHLACALVLFALLRSLLRLPLAGAWAGSQADGVAGSVALLWTVHPLNSEVINYATQRTESLMALAFLCTLYCGVRAITERGRTAWSTASVIACALGMACKESMAVAPVMMLIVESAFTQRSPVEVVRARPSYYAALFSTWLLLAALIIEGPRWRSAGFSSGVSPLTYLLEQPRLIVRYLRLVVMPTGLVLDYGEPTTRVLGSAIAPGLAVLILLGLTLVAWRMAPLLAFCGTWFFLTLSPTSSLVPIATEVGAERRMYLPLVGVLILVVVTAQRFIGRTSATPARAARAGGLLVGIACLALVILTSARNAEYRDPVRLWQTVVERWPDSARGHYNYGIELVAAGRRAEGIDQYRRALPGSADAYYALGFELQAEGRYEEALAHYRAFIDAKPLDLNVPRAYHQVGRALMQQGRNQDALVAFDEALARSPGDEGALGGRADTLLALGRLADAIAAYQRFLAAFPNRTDAIMNLGVALQKAERTAEARDAFAAVLAREPQNVAALVNYGYALANTGQPGPALQQFRLAARLEPNPAARADINAAIAELGGR